jgi:3-oxoacyl-[acyl-carrier protein] reductase
MPRFTDRVAIVTGAAQGMGFAIARRLLSEGASVVMADMNAERLA